MKKMRFGFILLSAACTLAISSCKFTVTNTDGLALAYKDIDRACSYASELRSMTTPTTGQVNEAADLYRQAKSELNSYLQKAITDAADYDVNNPKEEYLHTNGTAKVDAFEQKVRELRGVHIAAASAWIPIAKAVIEEILKINQENREEGRKRFEETVTKYMMKNYEEIPRAQ